MSGVPSGTLSPTGGAFADAGRVCSPAEVPEPACSVESTVSFIFRPPRFRYSRHSRSILSVALASPHLVFTRLEPRPADPRVGSPVLRPRGLPESRQARALERRRMPTLMRLHPSNQAGRAGRASLPPLDAISRRSSSHVERSPRTTQREKFLRRDVGRRNGRG